MAGPSPSDVLGRVTLVTGKEEFLGERTVAAVHQFLTRARRDRNPRVIAVATAAVRDASNRERLLGPLRRRDRVEVRILSGREEALLGALAVQSSMNITNGLVADLGGGSLQLTRLRRGHVASTSAVPIGAVRMTQRHLRADPPTPRELRELRTEVRSRLVKALPPAERGDEIVALGGTVRALGRIHLAARGEEHRSRHGLRLQQTDVTRITPTLLQSPFRIAQDLLSLDGFTVHRLGGGISLVRDPERVDLTFAVENLANTFYREHFKFAPSRGRTFTVGISAGVF